MEARLNDKWIVTDAPASSDEQERDEMTNDWITLNSIAMYEQRLRDIENERLARSVAARKPRSKIMRTALANLGQQMIVLGERLQHRGTATARIRASG